MIKSKDHDLELAFQLNDNINCFGLSENAILPENRNKGNYKPKTLIDQTLELIDPTPNIHTLFVQFNEQFFWNILLPVEVKWSNRMTSCAGICSFHPRNRQCVISLSAPLLKLRPRKDLVETLLHEMIHGYLFLTNNNRDRDGHGPEFCRHMDRINKQAGTRITIYHSFHDEVKLYKQHWWRCNGPCHKRAPYFGTVRRAMNRAPGPTDFWWKEHQQSCGGQFIKIKEPENFKSRTSKKIKPHVKSNNPTSDVLNWLKKTTPPVTPKFTPKSIKPPTNSKDLSALKKLGNATNNVHGWGTGGPNSLSNSKKGSSSTVTSVSNSPKFSSSGVLGGSNTGQSNLLNKFLSISQPRESNKDTLFPRKAMDSSSTNSVTKRLNVGDKQSMKEGEVQFVECPVCSNFVLNNDINKHIDVCLKIQNENSTKQGVNSSPPVLKRKKDTHEFSNKQLKITDLQNSKKINCPVCSKSFEFAEINYHLDKCILETNEQDNSFTDFDNTKDKSGTINDSIVSISSTSSNSSSSLIVDNSKNHSSPQFTKDNRTKTNSHKCLVCNEFISPDVSLNDHLEDCIGNVFKDDSILSIDCDNEETSETASGVSTDQNDKYPCPVCMQLVSELLMNQHLDTCLKNT